MQPSLPAARGPKPTKAPPPPPPPGASPAAVLASLFPMPEEMADEAVLFAARLLAAADERGGPRLRRCDVFHCEEVLTAAACFAPIPWASAGRVLKQARLHLQPPV